MILEKENTIVAGDNPVLQECLPQTRAGLAQRGQIVHFDEGTLIFEDGQRGGTVLFPLAGSLQMGKATSRGRRQIICNPTSSSCGGMCMLEFGEEALAEARGLGPGRVLMLPRSEFEDLIHSDPVLCKAAWHSAASCMGHLSRLVAQLSFNKVAERVVLTLLDATAANGDVVRLTQADLAAEVGTTREVVARCLAGLQADGLIRLGRARITVLDRDHLKASL